MPNVVLAKSFGICERYVVTTGEKIRRAIARKYGTRVTQRSAAANLNIPFTTLCEWLGDKYEPSVGSLRKIAAELGCNASSLIGDEAA